MQPEVQTEMHTHRQVEDAETQQSQPEESRSGKQTHAHDAGGERTAGEPVALGWLAE